MTETSIDEILSLLRDQKTDLEDRIAVLEIAIKSLMAKKRQYERRLK